MNYKPPFSITNKVLELSGDISKELGFLLGAKLKLPSVHLRRSNKIKTIQSSLSIEGNTLSIEQITTILEGKRVIAPKKGIIEAENAFKLYSELEKYDPLSIKHFLRAHKILMKSLISNNGTWRDKSVGILHGDKVKHVALQVHMVPTLMNDLFNFIKKDRSSWVIKACVFHYELEFIHPFSDGNGRMGRLWQQLLLMQEDNIFEYIPIETLIKNNQQEYYKVLSTCDRAGNSTLFIEFMLEQILLALQEYSGSAKSEVNDPMSRLNFGKDHFKDTLFSRRDYILLHKDISSATASRDLKYGVEKEMLGSSGAKNQTFYEFNNLADDKDGLLQLP